MNKKRILHRNNIILGLSILALITSFFVIGYHYGVSKLTPMEAIAGNGSGSTNVDLSPFWKTWNILNEKYIANDKVNDKDKVWGAIKGLAASYNDPYTEFFPPTEAKEFHESINGTFGGVGLEIGIKDKILTVIAPLKGTPAEKSGIKSGDKILKINETITSDMTVEKAISLIRGEPGTKVTLTTFREGDKEPKAVILTREVIDIPTIDTEARKDGIYVIRLYQFSANSTKLFQNALKDFVKTGDKKLILDLRGNPGGYLDVAVDMASWFLPSGKKVVTEDYGEKEKPVIYRSRGYSDISSKVKIVVLVDGGSASASEILAGALKENGVATLVGEKTYGKGVVQELIDVADGSELKITVARWLTPNGNSINELGITPDYVVEITDKDIEAKRDSQMEKAVEVLNK